MSENRLASANRTVSFEIPVKRPGFTSSWPVVAETGTELIAIVCRRKAGCPARPPPPPGRRTQDRPHRQPPRQRCQPVGSSHSTLLQFSTNRREHGVCCT